jgi:hypothetical protein
MYGDEDLFYMKLFSYPLQISLQQENLVLILENTIGFGAY